jgi:hypothetical protein
MSEHAEAVLERVGQVICGLHGHDEIVEFGGNRMFLRCVNCGHESPGWEVSPVPRAVASRRPPLRAFEMGKSDTQQAA